MSSPAAAAAGSTLPAGQLNAGATPLPQPAAAPGNAQTMTVVDLPVHLYGRDDPVRKKCRVKKYWYSLRQWRALSGSTAASVSCMLLHLISSSNGASCERRCCMLLRCRFFMFYSVNDSISAELDHDFLPNRLAIMSCGRYSDHPGIRNGVGRMH